MPCLVFKVREDDRLFSLEMESESMTELCWRNQLVKYDAIFDMKVKFLLCTFRVEK